MTPCPGFGQAFDLEQAASRTFACHARNKAI